MPNTKPSSRTVVKAALESRYRQISKSETQKCSICLWIFSGRGILMFWDNGACRMTDPQAEPQSLSGHRSISSIAPEHAQPSIYHHYSRWSVCLPSFSRDASHTDETRSPTAPLTVYSFHPILSTLNPFPSSVKLHKLPPSHKRQPQLPETLRPAQKFPGAPPYHPSPTETTFTVFQSRRTEF